VIGTAISIEFESCLLPFASDSATTVTAGKQAKILSADQIDDLLFFASQTQPNSQSTDRAAVGQSRLAGRRDRQADLGDGADAKPSVDVIDQDRREVRPA
jgi:hypothetical protein